MAGGGGGREPTWTVGSEPRLGGNSDHPHFPANGARSRPNQTRAPASHLPLPPSFLPSLPSFTWHVSPSILSRQSFLLFPSRTQPSLYICLVTLTIDSIFLLIAFFVLSSALKFTLSFFLLSPYLHFPFVWPSFHSLALFSSLPFIYRLRCISSTTNCNILRAICLGLENIYWKLQTCNWRSSYVFAKKKKSKWFWLTVTNIISSVFVPCLKHPGNTSKGEETCLQSLFCKVYFVNWSL